MAKLARAYESRDGQLHKAPEKALKADLAAILGRVGKDSGMTEGVAALILDKRCEIEAVFADADRIRKEVGREDRLADKTNGDGK